MTVRVLRAASWSAAIAIAHSALAAPPLVAQGLSFRVGGMRTQYADSLEGSAATLALRVLLAAGGAQAALEGSLSRFSAGAWAVQGGGGALWVARLGGPLSVGIAADGSANYLEGGTTSGTVAAGPVLAAVSGPWLASATANAGVLRRTDGVADRSLGGTIRLGYDHPLWRAGASLARTDAGWARYSDASGSFEVRRAALAVAVTGGVRTGDLGNEGWVQARAAWRFVPWASLELSAGSSPPDPTGFTRGSFVVAGVRLGVTRAGVAADFAAPRPGSALGIETSSDGRIRAIFTVPGAVSLAIAGAWNEWTPTPLTPLGDGRWLALLALNAGAHRFTLVDGRGRSFVPAGILSVPDDFGGKAGLLIVGP